MSSSENNLASLKDKIKELASLCPDLHKPQKDKRGFYHCQFCSSDYSTEHSYRAHLRIRDKCIKMRHALGIPVLREVKFECDICHKIFRNNQHYKFHKCLRNNISSNSNNVRTQPIKIEYPSDNEEDQPVNETNQEKDNEYSSVLSSGGKKISLQNWE